MGLIRNCFPYRKAIYEYCKGDADKSGKEIDKAVDSLHKTTII